MLKSKLKNIISLKLLTSLFLATVFFVLAPSAQAATRYWVGGGSTTNWDQTGSTNWGTASATQDNASVPIIGDNVIFDSGYSGSCDVSSGAGATSLDFTGGTGYIGTFNMFNAMTVSGNVTFSSGMSLGGGNLLTINNTATLVTAGKVIPFRVRVSGTVSLGDNFTGDNNATYSVFYVYTGGIFNTNGYNMSSVYRVTDYNYSGTWNLGSSTISCTIFSIASATTTMDADEATINVAGDFAGGDKIYGTVNLIGTASTVSGTNTFTNLIRTGTAVKTDTMTLAANQIVTGTLTLNGNSSTNRIMIQSNTKGTSRTITAASVSVSNADFQDITGTGTGSWNLSAITGLSGDAGGNSGITFTTAVSQYWHQGTGNWSDSTKWFLATNGTGGTGRVPLPQDDVYFDVNSFDSGSQKITPDMPRLGKSIDFSAVANNPEFEVSIYNSVFGSLTFGTIIFDYIAWVGITFEGRGAYTFTSNGKAVLKVTLNAPGGSLTLTDALLISVIKNLIIIAGTFSDGGNNVTAGGINISGTKTRSVVMSDGSSTTWTVLRGQNFTSGWGATTTTNLTFSPGQSTIDLNWTSATFNKIFYGGGLTYNNVKFSGINREVRVTGSNTFNNLEISPGVTVWFTAGTTNTFNTFTANGTTANPIIINSITAASHTLAKAGGGTVNCTHCSISNSTATPADTWYATFSTDSGNNSGWIFNPTQIYRSVGPGSTTALATSGSNTMTINGSTVAFNSGLPDNVGVGDVIQYDDGGSATPDSLAFISGRISSTHYTVTDITGDVANFTSANTNWSLFRAYTSLANAEKGVENTGIDSTLRNFDDWTAGGDATTDDVGKDIASSSEIWNIACYGDATDSTAVTVDGWTTTATNYIKIYTPYLSSEVGVSQRHEGVWDEGKYHIITTAGLNNISIQEDFVRIFGIQSYQNGFGSTFAFEVINISANNDIRIAYCIGRNKGATVINIDDADSNLKIWNNILYDASSDWASGISFVSANKAYVYNNTIYNSSIAIRIIGGTIIAKNNIAQNCINVNGCFSGTFDTSSDYNISDISGDAPNDTFGGGHTTVNFLDEANNNFHLAVSDTSAWNAGTDLSADANLSFTDDIDGEARPGGASWDIGADELKKTTQINTPHTNKWTDGLVGYWSFDGQDMDWSQSTAEARDTSGNNNHGDVINGATPVSGKVGQGMSFDGVDDYVGVSNFNLSDSFTLSVWINNNSSSNNFMYQNSGAANRWLFNISNNKLSFYTDVYGWKVGTVSLNSGWNYVVAVGENDLINYYVNGVYDNINGAIGEISNNNSLVTIGKTTNGYFNGTIDEVRIYNRVLSSDEITEQYQAGIREMQVDFPLVNNLTNGLVGHWTFNGQDMDWGSSTAEAIDRSGQGNDGDVIGATAVSGISGQGMSFDGVDDYINCGSDSSLDDLHTKGGMSISAWIYPYTSGEVNAGRIIDKDSNHLESVYFSLSGTKLQLVKDGSTNLVVRSSDNDIKFNQWQHVAVAWDGSTVATNAHLYINGAEVIYSIQNDGVSLSSEAARSLRIGSRGNGALAFDGIIDEVRIYNRVLSEDEIGQLYQMGAREASF